MSVTRSSPPVHGVHVDSVGRGPPLVLLHGWAMHSGLFAPLLPRLVERYRVHLVDLPGHGRSAGMATSSLEAMTRAVADAVARLPDVDDEPALVLGWSLGGAVALQWALAAPQRVRGLLLVATTPCFVARADWPHAVTAATLKRFGDELTVSYRLTLQRFLTLQVQGSERARAALAELRGQLFARGEPSPEALRAGLALLERIDLRDRVAAVRQRSLVIAGDRDALASPGAGEWLARALPHASFLLLRGAGHAPFLSHRERFLAALAELADGA
jgi:pimeloyl-[acyl-carrier protein] methyl ester esterase